MLRHQPLYEDYDVTPLLGFKGLCYRDFETSCVHIRELPLELLIRQQAHACVSEFVFMSKQKREIRKNVLRKPAIKPVAAGRYESQRVSAHKTP